MRHRLLPKRSICDCSFLFPRCRFPKRREIDLATSVSTTYQLICNRYAKRPSLTKFMLRSVASCTYSPRPLPYVAAMHRTSSAQSILSQCITIAKTTAKIGVLRILRQFQEFLLPSVSHSLFRRRVSCNTYPQCGFCATCCSQATFRGGYYMMDIQ